MLSGGSGLLVPRPRGQLGEVRPEELQDLDSEAVAFGEQGKQDVPRLDFRGSVLARGGLAHLEDGLHPRREREVTLVMDHRRTQLADLGAGGVQIRDAFAAEQPGLASFFEAQ